MRLCPVSSDDTQNGTGSSDTPPDFIRILTVFPFSTMSAILADPDDSSVWKYKLDFHDVVHGETVLSTNETEASGDELSRAYWECRCGHMESSILRASRGRVQLLGVNTRAKCHDGVWRWIWVCVEGQARRA